ncbi:MAG: anti-sigma F factor [Lachnospiraceae bacterium]|nr:anti-sigma F factor [Lachnospiraceae bacterium]
MNNTNEMTVSFSSNAQNEGFARMVVASFIAGTNPTLEEVSDVKTAVSEAVTNSIIHGYREKKGQVRINASVTGRKIYIEVIDEGEGIADVKKAMEPMYTSRPEEERSGMGFSFMEAFMDKIKVESGLGSGTTVKMWKEIGTAGRQFE